MKKLTAVIALIFFMLFPALAACGGEEKPFGFVSVNEYVMGTRSELYVTDGEANGAENEARANALFNQTDALLFAVEASVGCDGANSRVRAFNEAEAGATVPLDKYSYEVLSAALSAFELTGGAYNPAVYYNVELWGFSQGAYTDFNGFTLPDSAICAEYAALASHFGETRLYAEGEAYYAVKPQATAEIGGESRSIKIDLSGLAKGYCADLVARMAKDAGFEYGYFNFGNSSYAIGKYARGDCYTVSVQDPRTSGDFCKFNVKDEVLSTSGDYMQYFERDGVRYCHIIDSRTGCPIRTGIASVTVVGGSAAEDDALTTALSAMSLTDAVEFVNGKLTDRKVIITHFGEGGGKIITNLAGDGFTVINGDYALANTLSDGKIILNSDVS